MIIERKRHLNFQTMKSPSGDYWLRYIRRHDKPYGVWNIPFEYGGRLATSIGDAFEDSKEVSYRRLPESLRLFVVQAVEHIEKHGDPIDNDEHIYAAEEV
jgi:hypothetical protein